MSYPKTDLTAGTTYWYTFRGSNDMGNFWAEPSWMFVTLPGGGCSGTVFFFE